MTRALKLDTVIDKALRKLQSLQAKNGSFESAGSTQPDMSNPEPRLTTFATSLILISLRRLTGQAASARKSIVDPGLDFLLRERHDDFSWNYWQRQEKKSKTTPNDLDATFCALAALQLYRSETLDGPAFTKIVRLLTDAEVDEGGPYNTWIIDRQKNPSWNDLDTMVNANITYFLSLQDISVPKLQSFMHGSIESATYLSRYYKDPLVALYFLSRAYGTSADTEVDRRQIKRQILDMHGIKTHWGNPLRTAMALSGLLTCGVSDEEFELIRPAIQYLCSAFQKGDCKAFPVYVQQEGLGVSWQSGAEAVTIACLIEAFSLYQAQVQNIARRNEVKKHSDLEQSVIQKFNQDFAALPTIREAAERLSRGIVDKDPSKQITLLPYFFNNSLRKRGVDTKTLILLGSINLAGWIAYRIFDDLLDNEGRPELLPLASKCLRDVSASYCRLLPDGAFRLFESIMDDLDQANAWERAMTHVINERYLHMMHGKFQTSLPDFSNHEILAEKSLAHAMGPITVLSLLGYKHNHEYIKQTISFFRHYIIARQLNDDAHDWQTDLEKGFINSAAVQILTTWRTKKQKNHRGKSIEFTLAQVTEELQSIFWHKNIVQIADKVYENIRLARQCLSKIKILKNPEYLQSLLLPLEKATDKALREREKTLSFLEAYKEQ